MTKSGRTIRAHHMGLTMPDTGKTRAHFIDALGFSQVSEVATHRMKATVVRGLSGDHTAHSGQAAAGPSSPHKLLLVRLGRLKYLIDVNAPGIIVRNELRLVGSAVRTLIDSELSMQYRGRSGSGDVNRVSRRSSRSTGGPVGPAYSQRTFQ